MGLITKALYFKLTLIAVLCLHSCTIVQADSIIIEGSVHLESGDPAAGYKISLSKKNTGWFPSYQEIALVAVGDSGSFRFEVEKQGSYSVAVLCQDRFGDIVGRDIEIGNEKVEKVTFTLKDEWLE